MTSIDRQSPTIYGHDPRAMQKNQGKSTGGARGRKWVHKKIPGCAVELNTQNCAWFGSQIYLITAMSFREAMPPRTTHQGLFRSPDPVCPPLPNPGYAAGWGVS